MEVAANGTVRIGGNLRTAYEFYLHGGSLEVGGEVLNTDDFVGFTTYGGSLLVHGDFVNVTKQTSSTFPSEVHFSNLSQCEIKGNLTNNGSLTSFYSPINVGKKVTNVGDFTIEGTATSNFQGDLSNSGTFRVSDAQSVLEVAGNLDNSGGFAATDGGRAIFHGTLVQQVNGELTGGQIGVRGGSLSWAGADIHSIAQGAALTMSAGGTIRDSLSDEDGLRNLSENRGQLNIEKGSALTTAGNFSNPGYISIYSADSNAITVQGDFSNGGSFRDYGSYKTSAAETTMVLGNLTNAKGASLSVVYGAILRVDGDVSNLGSLNFTNGSRFLAKRAVNNIGTLSLSQNVQADVSGALVNFGSLNVTDTGTLLTISGDLDNTGSIFDSYGAQIVVNGTLRNQDAGTLQAGSLRIGNNSSLQWNDADIRVLAAGATITLSGSGSLKRTSDGGSALLNFSENRGTFQIDSGAVLSIAGNFANSGTLTVGSAATLLDVSDGMSNTGKLIASSGGRFRFMVH
jgi:formylmethanofuran dehydrogenase subunit C